MSKRVLISGCSSGIGRALAIELTERGHHVIATARKPADLDGLSAAQRLTLDVTSQESVDAAVCEAGAVDVLVNNAGVGLWGPGELVPIDVAQRLFDVNVFGPMRLQKALLPQMRERGSGLVVQVSSLAGRTAGPLLGHYAASKHALEAMSAALRVELAPFGVNVVVVELGAVESDFGRNRFMLSGDPYERLVEHFRAKISGSRVGAVSSADTARCIADIIETGGANFIEVPDATARAMIEGRLAMTPEQYQAQLLSGFTHDAPGMAK